MTDGEKPPVTGTTHELPFDKLSPRDFERLVLWLVQREGFENVEHFGAAGADGGRDIQANAEDKRWVFQAKRVQVGGFGFEKAKLELEKVLSLPEAQKPDVFVFAVSWDISAKTRDAVREFCGAHLDCIFWAKSELDEKAKRFQDLVAEFFQLSESQGEGSSVSRLDAFVLGSTVGQRFNLAALDLGSRSSLSEFCQILERVGGEARRHCAPLRELLDDANRDASEDPVLSVVQILHGTPDATFGKLTDGCRSWAMLGMLIWEIVSGPLVGQDEKQLRDNARTLADRAHAAGLPATIGEDVAAFATNALEATDLDRTTHAMTVSQRIAAFLA